MRGTVLRLAVIVLLCAASAPPAAVAQQATGAGPQPVNLDGVVVTGSAIPSSDLDSEHPITVIGAEALRRSGTVTLQQYLQQVPSVGLQGLTSNQVFGLLNGSGNNFVDLRNLGSARTLVLIDGKRFPPSSNETEEAVDIGNIPVPLIDHIEILRDGASPLYGADAIGGVINVILRKHFSGFEVGSQVGLTSYGDGVSWDANATFGQKLGGSNLVLDFDVNSTDPILQRKRPWAHNRFIPGDPEGTLQVGVTPDGTAYYPGSGPLGNEFNGSGIVQTPYSDLYDLSTFNYLTIGQRRFSLNGLFDIAITADARFYAEALFTDRLSSSQFSPPGVAFGFTTDAKYPDPIEVPAKAPGNPFDTSVDLLKILVPQGPGQGSADAPTYRLLAGFRGKLPANFKWDVSYLYGDAASTLTASNNVNYTHALQEIGVLPCGGSAGCVPGNFFGPDSLSQAAAQYLLYNSRATSNYAEQSLDATLNGFLPGLPAGRIGLAIAGDYRRLSGQFIPDAVTLAGDQDGADTQPTHGAYDAKEAFLEVKLPLLAALPAVQEFDLLGAARYSKFGSFGDAVTWKAGLDWVLTPDLRIRGAHSTGFRAPQITELYLGKTGISSAENDPCDSQVGLTSNPVVAANCAAQGVPANYVQPGNNYLTFLSGNPVLQPETSQNWTAGTVLTPRWAPGLSLTLDYYNILVRNEIGQLNPDLILNDCYESANLSSPDCANVGKRLPGSEPALTTITDTEGNLGDIKTDGLDLALHYELPLRGLGLPGHNTLVLDNLGTWIFAYDEQTAAGSPFIELAGTEDLPTSPTNPGLIAHFRNNTALDLRHDGADLAWTVRYIGSGNAAVPQGPSPAAPGNHTPATVYHDLAGSYRLKGLTFTLGMNNVFNKSPPFYNDGTVNTNEFTYDVVGRFIYFNFKASLGEILPH